MSDAGGRQSRINSLLNASHNSQAERDYLRQRILEIFEEDEKELENQTRPSDGQDEGSRKKGMSTRSKSLENIKTSIATSSSGIGSDDLESRTSIQFIDVVQRGEDPSRTKQSDTNNWHIDPRGQSNGMVVLDEMEDFGKKNSVAQTDMMTPWLHQHQSTSTKFLQGKMSQTDSYGQARYL